jgi:lysophospholipase L1-like esterase
MISAGLVLAMLGYDPATAESESSREVASRPASQPASQPDGGLKIAAGEQIVAMGDSITQAGGYLKVIDAVFAQQDPDLRIPKIINVGIGGQKAEDMVARFEKDVIARKPGIVTISVGINDVWHLLDKPHDPAVLEAYGRNVERMVKMAQDAGVKVIILSPTVIQEDLASEGNKRLKLYVRAGRQIARERRCAYVDLHEMFLKVIEKNRARKPEQGASASDDHLTTDGVHMAPMGDTLMAVGVLRALGVPDEKIGATDLSEVFKKK